MEEAQRLEMGLEKRAEEEGGGGARTQALGPLDSLGHHHLSLCPHESEPLLPGPRSWPLELAPHWAVL